MFSFYSSGKFCFLSFFFILIFNFLNILLFFYIYFLFAFPTVLFPLQLIFNVYKSSLSTSL